jgi:hypothetical protein
VTSGKVFVRCCESVFAVTTTRALGIVESPHRITHAATVDLPTPCPLARAIRDRQHIPDLGTLAKPPAEFVEQGMLPFARPGCVGKFRPGLARREGKKHEAQRIAGAR